MAERLGLTCICGMCFAWDAALVIRVLGAILAVLFLPVTSAEQANRAPHRIQIADGVFLFTTPPYGDVGLDGNSIAILSPDGVLVFDSNGTPAASAAVLAQIRRMTEQPVRYIVNSHWHWDHWYGSEVYKQQFPEVQIVAHEKTRQMMMGPALEFNRPGLETELPGYLSTLESKVAAARSASPPPPELSRLTTLLEADRSFLEQKRNVHHTFPNVTFTDQLNIYLGGRAIQVLHYDRAVTPGDAFLFLPKERILITGDLLVNPISFALSCYPTGWLRTLEKIDALDAAILVPGHGEPLHDKALLHATMDVFRELLRLGRDAKSRGVDVARARDAIMPGLHELMLNITHDDPGLNQAFRVQLVDWYLRRVYDELNGPLTDDIAPIPRG